MKTKEFGFEVGFQQPQGPELLLDLLPIRGQKGASVPLLLVVYSSACVSCISSLLTHISLASYFFWGGGGTKAIVYPQKLDWTPHSVVSHLEL